MALTKQSAIEILFSDGCEQKDIARILKLSEATVSRHVTDNDLRQKRARHSLAKKTAQDNALIALEYQSTIIRLMAEKLKSTLSDNPEMEDLKAALIPKGEIDALQKLFTTIKNKETEWEDVIKIMRRFNSFLERRDIELTQEVVDHIDEFINQERNSLV